MTSRVVTIVGGTLIIMGTVGLIWSKVPRPLMWFCFFVALAMDFWRALTTGEIKSNLGFGRGCSTYNREDTPIFFLWAAIIEGLMVFALLILFCISFY